ncbi:hypothetical protein V6N11_001797 [Hibiscus sabdariffa]|uniref:Uncharacterized protein n=1 Tax=Hibiscus sabdariffa TaxID=183260 RepID=A0ABR2QTK9_9ROSI
MALVLGGIMQKQPLMPQKSGGKVVPEAQRFKTACIDPELEEKLDQMFRGIVATSDKVWAPSSGILSSDFVEHDNIEALDEIEEENVVSLDDAYFMEYENNDNAYEDIIDPENVEDGDSDDDGELNASSGSEMELIRDVIACSLIN